VSAIAAAYKMKQFVGTVLSLLFVVFPSVFCLDTGYQLSESVSLLKRSQHKGYRSSWSELAEAEAPKFGIEKTVELHALQDQQQTSNLDHSEPFKIQFSFDDSKFLTSWITVFDGYGNNLHYLNIRFYYTGNYITKMKYTTLYHDKVSTAQSQSKSIFLRYEFIEQPQSSPMSGINVLLIAGLAACLILTFTTVTDANKPQFIYTAKNNPATVIKPINSSIASDSILATNRDRSKQV
jgi:hypothetical protein